MDIDTADLSGIEALTLQGAVVGDQVGWSVSAAGDVNNDGYADLIVGAQDADPDGRFDAGAAYVILGSAAGLGTVDSLGFVSGNSTGFVIWGAAAGDRLGRSVSGAGGVNGDCRDDVIVGAQYASPNGRLRAGAAYVLFGNASGFADVDLLGFSSGAFFT
jgi:hypothetical protein